MIDFEFRAVAAAYDQQIEVFKCCDLQTRIRPNDQAKVAGYFTVLQPEGS